MTEWYLINPQPTLNSGFEKDEFTDYAQDGFDELLTETQLGKTIKFCRGKFDGENFEVEVEGEGIVQSETPDAYTQGYKRQLLTRIADKVAEYKYIKYDGAIWLIMTEPSDNCIYDKCVLHQCNYILKWQNVNTDIIYCPASIENASQYNTGEEGNKILMLGYNQLMAYVSLDDDTVVIDRNLRLFVDYNKVNPIPYKVTRPDTVAFSYGKNRVMCLVLTEDQYNPKTDNIDLMICDYFEIELSEASSPIEITYVGNPTVRIGGSKTFRVKETAVTFTMSIADMFKDMVSFKQIDDFSCKISVKNNEMAVGANLKIIAISKNGDKGELLINIVGGV